MCRSGELDSSSVAFRKRGAPEHSSHVAPEGFNVNRLNKLSNRTSCCPRTCDAWAHPALQICDARPAAAEREKKYRRWDNRGYHQQDRSSDRAIRSVSGTTCRRSIQGHPTIEAAAAHEFSPLPPPATDVFKAWGDAMSSTPRGRPGPQAMLYVSQGLQMASRYASKMSIADGREW